MNARRKKNRNQPDDNMPLGFADVTQDGLVKMYGKQTCDRAQDYVGKVQKLRLCDDCSVVASINGAASYITRVKSGSDDKIEDKCTCPVGLGCKHAVALVLAIRKKLANGEGIARLSATDGRIYNVLWEDEKSSAPEEGTPESVEYEAWRALREAVSTPGRDRAWEEYERKTYGSWDDDDDDEGFYDENGEWHDVDEYVPPDYKTVKEHFERLAELNRIDALVAMGKELMESSQPQLDVADDGDEIALEVLGCLKVVNGAVRRSKASVAVKNDFNGRLKSWKRKNCGWLS